MKKSLSIFLLSLLFIITSCQLYDPPLCNITVAKNYNGSGTVTVEKDTALLGEYVKVTVEPSEAYTLGHFSYETIYSQDTVNPNLYYVLINKLEYKIEYTFASKETYRISYNSLDVSFENSSYSSAYEGKSVVFTVKEKSRKYYTIDSIKVFNKSASGVEETYTVTATDKKNTFSFVMPKNAVTIEVTYMPDMSILPQKNKYKSGEKIIYNVDNHTGINNYDVYIDYCPTDSYRKLYKRNVDLSSKTLEIDSNSLGIGTFKLLIANVDEDDFYNFDNQIIIEPTDLPENWKPVGLYLISTSIVSNQIKASLIFSNVTDYSVKYKSYLKSKPDEIKYGTLYSKTSYTYSHDFLYDSKDTIVLYIYDENLKYMSNKIEIEIPIYETISRQDYENYYYNDLGFSKSSEFKKLSVKLDDDAKEYFSCYT